MRPQPCAADAWENPTITTRSWACEMDTSADQQSRTSNSTRLERFLASVEQDAYRLVLAACRDPDDAVDLVQDAMTQLVVKYRHLDAAQWAPLFHRILQNRIRDWYRRRKVKNTLLRWAGLGGSTEQTDKIEADARYTPEALMDGEDKLTSICHAVAQLPLRQQQVFLLRAWKEFSVNETAQAMSISAGSVKTHYSRALNTLRESLVMEADDS